MSYKGASAKITLGQMGLYTDAAPDSQPPNALVYAKNVDLSTGTVQKAPGSLKYNATPLSAGIVAVRDWWSDVATQRLIAVTANGSIYKGKDRTFGDTLNSGLGALTANCVFAEGGQESAARARKLILFTDGRTKPYVLTGDGTSFILIANPSVDWVVGNYPTFGLIHKNRLWAFCGQIAYASDTADHENFTTNALAKPCYTGEGGAFIGAFVFKGRIFAFKEGGFAYAFIDTDTDSSNWYWQRISSSFSLSAPNAAGETQDDLVIGNNSGTLTSLTASQSLGEVEAADLFKAMQFEQYVKANTSRTGLAEQHILYYPAKKQLYMTGRSAYYTYNDLLICVDFNRENPRATFLNKGTPQCLALRKDSIGVLRPMYGDKDGYVHFMDYEDRSEGGTAYTGAFQTVHTDFSYLDPSMSAKTKHFNFLAVTYVPTGAHNLSCDYFIDGKFVETITFSMDQFQKPQLDVLLLSTDRLGQNNVETSVRPLKGSGRTFSAYFYNSGVNQSFEVSAITVGFKPGTQQAQKV